MRHLLEILENRAYLAVTATFLPGSGLLSVFGDAADNVIVISRDAAGSILVNGGAVVVTGGTPTVANTAKIQVYGLAGDDTLTLNEASGALPACNLFGGSGNDIVTGGSGGDLLFGQSGNDQILGKGGFDLGFGGSENDVLTGGDADDQSFGQSGDDKMIWNPGDDTDLNEGGTETDTVEVNGGNGAEQFAVTPNGTRVRFDRVVPAPFSIDIGTSEKLVLNANGGDDTVTGSNGLATLIAITVDGGAGNDSIGGGDGADNLLGGDGNDFIDGNRGNDTASMGAGDDVFQWDPGDGSDTIEGQADVDTMVFNGAIIAEIFDLSSNGDRLRFTRNIGTIVMDTNDLEKVRVNALGGADVLTVNDLTGTDVTEVTVDLAGTLGGASGDTEVDTVIVRGTTGADAVSVAGDASGVAALGLASAVRVINSEPANDHLNISALAGDDAVDASGLAANALLFSADGSDGDDVLIGSAGNDNFVGGAGDDVLIGGPGQDVLDGGPGDNVIIQD